MNEEVYKLLDSRLVSHINVDKLPRHIAIIMDGNGRWAKQRSLPRIAGHRAGVESVDHVVSCCRELGVKALTLYSFSLDNWKRPPSEIDALMEILKEYLNKEIDRMIRENIRFNVIGRIQDLPPGVRGIVEDAMDRTKDQDGMVLSLAISYGSRDEIIGAVRKIAMGVRRGAIVPEEIDAAFFEKFLYTSGLPEIDLLIRTSGEKRVSNFMLWQMAYTELFFTDVLWPDFREKELLEAVIEFQRRERRFGLTREQLSSKKG